jgi:flavin-dependent dehydrogenase
VRIVHILGAGPAGAAAAIAARSEGCAVTLFEKSSLPRHKVCGEFLSPEASRLLEQLGLWEEFLRAAPAPIHRLALHFGARSKHLKLPGCAYGMSRYRFDRLLVDHALALKAVLRTGGALAVVPEGSAGAPAATVLATGRSADVLPRERLFGFKAHFGGPLQDSLELYFFSGCYASVSPVEDGITNVCGLGPEELLRSHDFQIDRLLDTCAPLTERLSPLSRTMQWLTLGPLPLGSQWDQTPEEHVYPAGDALGFIDPFTSSGILNALLTGRLAGLAAAQGLSSQAHLEQCRRALAKPFRTAALIRTALRTGWAQHLAPLIPARWLFRRTRPVVA